MDVVELLAIVNYMLMLLFNAVSTFASFARCVFDTDTLLSLSLSIGLPSTMSVPPCSHFQFAGPRKPVGLVATICRISLSSASSDLLRVDRGIEANGSRPSGPSFPVKDCVAPWKGQL